MTTVIETWDSAADTSPPNMSGDNAWTPLSGSAQWQVQTHAARCVSNFDFEPTRCDVAVSTVNHRVAGLISATVGDGILGVLCRQDGAGTTQTFYAFVQWDDGTTKSQKLVKFIAGSATLIASAAGTFANGDTVEISAVGTLITGYKNTATIVSTNDSDITTGKNGGLFAACQQGGSFTNIDAVFTGWNLTDVAGGVQGAAAYHHRQQMVHA